MKKALITTSVAIILGSTSMVAYADTPGGGGPGFDSDMLQVLGDIDKWSKSTAMTLDSIAKSMFEVPSYIGKYIANLQNMNNASQAQTAVTQQTTEALQNLYQAKGSPAQSVDKAYNLSTKGSGDFQGLSAYSMLGRAKYKGNYYTTYNDDQAKAATTYSTFLSGAAIPMQAPSKASTMQQKKQVNMARTMAAIQSLDSYNISRVYAERYPTIDAEKSGVTIPTPNGKISKLGLVRYELQNSINNPQWYTDMSKAPPATVDRQMLFVLAAGVSELYRIEQNQEQMLLTQTATNTATLAMTQELSNAMNKASSVSGS